MPQYDELGNVISNDDTTPSQDDMRLALQNQQIRNQALQNRTTPASYAQREKALSLLPGELPAGGMSPMPTKPPVSTATNIPQALADRFGISALPQALISQIAGYPAALATSAGFPETGNAINNYFAPTSEYANQINEGVGKIIERIGDPFLGLHGGKLGISPEDVRALGGSAKVIKNDIRNISNDFYNSQRGNKRVNELGEKPIGVKLQEAADSVGDTLGRRDKPLFQIAGFDPLADRNLYAVRKKGEGQLIEPVRHTPSGATAEMILPDFYETSSYLGSQDPLEANLRPMTKNHLVTQHAGILNSPELEEHWRNFVKQKVQQMYPDVSQDDANTFVKLNYTTDEQNDMKANWRKEWADSAEAKTLAANVDKNLIPLEEAERRINAARNWINGPFKKHIATYAGTEADPLLEMASRGLTFTPAKSFLEENDENNLDKSLVEIRRAEADYPTISKYNKAKEEAEGDLEYSKLELRNAQAKRNELARAYQDKIRSQYDPEFLTSEEGSHLIDPANDEEYAKTTNEIAKLKKQVADAHEHFDNMRLASTYEDLNDLTVHKYKALDLMNRLPYALQKTFFPNLEKTPEDAAMIEFAKSGLHSLGITEMGRQYVKDIMSGNLPVEQIPNMPITKYVEKIAKPRVLEERNKKLEQAAKMKRFEEHLEQVVQNVPENKKFTNANAVEFTDKTPEKDIRAGLSTDTYCLDHCIGGGGVAGDPHFITGRTTSYAPAFDPVTGEPTEGSHGRDTHYMEAVKDGSKKITSIRDNVTGMPIVTIEMDKANANNGSKLDDPYHYVESNFRDLGLDRLADVFERNSGHYVDEAENDHDRIIAQLEDMLMSGEIDEHDDGINIRNINEHERAALNVSLNKIIENKKSGANKEAPKYRLGYVSGYKNSNDGPINKKYQNDVRDYLNSVADEITGIGSNLEKNAGVYDKTNSFSIQQAIKAAGLKRLDVSESAVNNELPRFITVDDIKRIANQEKPYDPRQEESMRHVTEKWLNEQPYGVRNWFQNHFGEINESSLPDLRRYATDMQSQNFTATADALNDLLYRLEDFQRGSDPLRRTYNGFINRLTPAIRSEFEMLVNPADIEHALTEENGLVNLYNRIDNIRVGGHPAGEMLGRFIEELRPFIRQTEPRQEENIPELTQRVFDELHEHFDRLMGDPPGTQRMRDDNEVARRRVLNDRTAQEIIEQLPGQYRGVMHDIFATNAIPHPNERNQQPVAQGLAEAVQQMEPEEPTQDMFAERDDALEEDIIDHITDNSQIQALSPNEIRRVAYDLINRNYRAAGNILDIDFDIFLDANGRINPNVIRNVAGRLYSTADQIDGMDNPPEGHKKGGLIKSKVYFAENKDEMKLALVRRK
jgi:hypothetical protein